MSSVAESEATLSSLDIDAITAALASVDTRNAVLRVAERIATQRMQIVVFSASVCHLEAMEVERVYSSRPGTYRLGARTNKRQTSWGRQVLLERRVFVGEGALEMAAAFDDQEGMASVGVRSIINVPIVVRDRCLGVLNFGRGVERVGPADVAVARLLGIACSTAFVSPPAAV
jgi:GAF domain-containing protein